MKPYCLLLAMFLAHGASAARFDCALEKPSAARQDQLAWSFVDDFLSSTDLARLDASLIAFARETSNQILVVVVDTLCGIPEADLATALGHSWGLGQHEKDNGVVILVKPNGTPGERVVYIAVGYGLEPVIPDLMARRIVQEQIIPAFRKGHYFEGLDRAATAIMALAKGEYDEQVHGRSRSVPWPLVIFFLVVIGLMIYIWYTGVKRYAKVNNIDAWTAMWLMSQSHRQHGRPGRSMSGWGGFGGGGSSGGGGGFGGFGGGGFGGGGAGGRW